MMNHSKKMSWSKATLKSMSENHANSSPKKLLPSDYVLSNNDVLCGRGLQCAEYIGNIRFHSIVNQNLYRYKNVTGRHEKTVLLTSIVDEIRDSYKNGGGFVKYDPTTERYYEVGDYLAVSLIAKLLKLFIRKVANLNSFVTFLMNNYILNTAERKSIASF